LEAWKWRVRSGWVAVVFEVLAVDVNYCHYSYPRCSSSLPTPAFFRKLLFTTHELSVPRQRSLALVILLKLSSAVRPHPGESLLQDPQVVCWWVET